MSFQGCQGELNPQVAHEIPEAEEGAQMMQLTQVLLAQIVSSAVSQVVIQHVQQTGSNSLLATAANHVTQNTTAAVQEVQSPIKFDIPIFEDDSAASWLTWSQRVVYHARAYDFEVELAAAEQEGLGVRAGVFDGSNVDPARLRNVHV